MRNFAENPLSEHEKEALRNDLNKEVRNAIDRGDLRTGSSDGRKMLLIVETIRPTAPELNKLFRLTSPQPLIDEITIPTKDENPVIRDRFEQIVGVLCFVRGQFRLDYDRTRFMRTPMHFLTNETRERTPLEVLTELDALSAFSAIRGGAIREWKRLKRHEANKARDAKARRPFS